ncbi:MAG: hypothetical protein JW781_03675 [Deltaproteobacteria bacterium]|nr:hypothetical protein [Candidatus Anaeroferrophillacea bacterium]
MDSATHDGAGNLQQADRLLEQSRDSGGAGVLECGEEKTALDWLERIPAGEQQERDKLLLDIYDRQGNKQQQAEVARRSFRQQRGRIGFERWISIVGEDQRNELLSQEVRIILGALILSLTDAAFHNGVRIDNR